MNETTDLLAPQKQTGKIKRLFTGKNAYLFWAFLLPAVLMYISYLCFGMYPIKDESVLVLDLNAQYVYFFGALRRVLHGDASLLYSFSRAMGGEFLGIFAYYLASPLSFIVALFPKKMILDALLVLFLIKCGCCGLTFAYYLHKKRAGNKAICILFGCLYSLCGYGVIYQHNTMWIDCMALLPLIALGIEKLISEKKYLLFTISLAVGIFSNFYIGYMLCIFCAVYFFYAYFCLTENKIGERAHFLRALIRMGVFSAIAIGLAACILFPTYYSLGFGKTTFSSPTYTLKLRFDLLDFVRKFLFCSYDTVRPDGLPIVYCGILPLLLFPLFFETKRVQLRQKFGTVVLFILFLLSFSVDAVDKFWHGMQAPNWLNYRYSFMLVFILLIACAHALSEIRRFPASRISAVLFGWIILLFVMQKLLNWEDLGSLKKFACIFGSLGLLLVYTAAIALFRNKSFRGAAYPILTILLCVEMIATGVSTIAFMDADVVYSTRSSYLNNIAKYEDSVDYILENDSGFYRFDKTKHSSIDTPMAMGIRGFTNSTSTLDKSVIEFLHEMGLASKSHWSKYLGATAPFDSLFGVKYVIVDGEYDVPDSYTHYFSGEKTEVYENPNALPLAFAVNSDLKGLHIAYPKDYDTAVKNGDYEPFTAFHTPPERMNAMIAAMLGKSSVNVFRAVGDVTGKEINLSYSPVSNRHAKYTPTSDSGAYLSYDLTVEADGILYLYLPTQYPRKATVSVDGKDLGEILGNETDRMFSLGTFTAGESLNVMIKLEDTCLYLRSDVHDLFWYVDEEAYQEAFAALGTHPFNITDWREDKFVGTLTATEDRTTVFTSIPYDANWQVTVDGERVDVYKIVDALIAFDVTPGTHDIVIRYIPRQLLLGSGISLISLTLLLAIVLLGKRRKAPAAPLPESTGETSQETNEHPTETSTEDNACSTTSPES